jgi:glycogen operon protein
MIEPGCPTPLGATADASGTNFAVYSSVAERVELCLFDSSGHQAKTIDLPGCTDDIWHGYLPDCNAGQSYGYRVHGPYAPEIGQRCNPHKLLVDPYARALSGKFGWHESVFDRNNMDSAGYMPKSVVSAPFNERLNSRPRVPWSEMVFYEANVRGYTMRHPGVAEADRGRFSGMCNAQVLEYLKALGITSLELMPVHEFIDEHHLYKLGLRNFWGYNTISFFAPSSRYAKVDARAEFLDMVRSIHDAGIEVILDVVYNHTGESDTNGPTISFRGLDNLAYYSTEAGSPGAYINDTGCGNTVNADHVRVQQMILDSLRYWHLDMGVDGFRFDLAPVLGRHDHGFSSSHPLLQAISNDESLHDAILIAEPWDPGPDGYQLGHFPERWSEWNDRYRDDVRRFWRGDQGSASDFAKRLHGSADVFEASGRTPLASFNMIASHDGFTLADVVSYKQRHNEANGEDNKDGHSHNFSCNHGAEGPSDDTAILDVRRRQRLNMLASLLLSQGTPLLLAGDEFGHTQDGNNNAYAQDNDTAWLDWSKIDEDPGFLQQVKALIKLRREEPLLRSPAYVHDEGNITWLKPDGHKISNADWDAAHALTLVLGGKIAVLINASSEAVLFALPGNFEESRLLFGSSPDVESQSGTVSLPALSLATLTVN